MSAFASGSGFSASWIHFFVLMVTGVMILGVASALVVCVIHKLNEKPLENSGYLILTILFIVVIVAILLGVFQTM
tara:strand:- start:61010 stop:61234 length:225 start_codon:yes stop_codon:yes gene_type:complete